MGRFAVQIHGEGRLVQPLDHQPRSPELDHSWPGRKPAFFIEPGSPWQNGYCASFNSKMRSELSNGEIFFNLKEARVVIETGRQHY